MISGVFRLDQRILLTMNNDRLQSLSMLLYLWLKNGNQWFIKENIFVHFWQIYQKPLIAFLTNLCLQNYMRIVLSWEHYNWYIITLPTEKTWKQKTKNRSKWRLQFLRINLVWSSTKICTLRFAFQSISLCFLVNYERNQLCMSYGLQYVLYYNWKSWRGY